MARKPLRCLLGRHTWTAHVLQGEEYLVCSECGKDGGSGAGGPSTKPPMWGSTPTGYYPRDE
jgi:hypothetical protein